MIEDLSLDKNNTATATATSDGANNTVSNPNTCSPLRTNTSNVQLPRQRKLQHQILGYVMAAFVFLLVSIIAASGIFIALPGALSSTLLSPLLPLLQISAGILYVCILLSYTSIITNHPGPIKPLIGVESNAVDEPQQGALNDWRFCSLCRQGKPPTAHHCRRCATCVQDLDHHCLFTANKCIGAGNLKPFLRFLSLVLVGCIFAFIAASIMGWRNRIPIIRHTANTWFRPLVFNSSFLHAFSFVWRWVLTAQLPLAAWALAFMLSFSSGSGVALLLRRQLRLKNRGSTVLEELQRRRRELQAATAAAGEGGFDTTGGEVRQDPLHSNVSKDKSM